MKRRKFIHWVFGLPLVGKWILLLCLPRPLEAIPLEAIPLEELPRKALPLESHANNIGKVFADIFWLSVGGDVDSKVVDLDAIYGCDREWKTISYLAGDNLQARVGTVDAVVEQLVKAVKDDLIAKGSKKITFYRLPLSPNYGVPQYRPEFYDTCLSVSIGRDRLGLSVTLCLMYEVKDEHHEL